MRKAQVQRKATHSPAARSAARSNSGGAARSKDAVNSAQLKAVSLTLNANPTALAQRKLKDSMQQGSQAVAQKAKADSLQAKFLGDSSVAQRAGQEEELMQGKFKTAQLMQEEEPLQGKFDTAQLMQEEEPLQGKFDTAQLMQEEEPLQGKFDTAQLMQEEEPLQGKAKTAQLEEKPAANNTGLPDNLKAGIENLSGMSMDNVQVHYNSDKPAQLNAHAYAQGTDIHVASGQEKHLPHEAWHVVQQAQGRVQPTTQMAGGTQVNDDNSLESEADVMGAKAMQFKAASQSTKSSK
jgi:hypothetical protein